MRHRDMLNTIQPLDFSCLTLANIKIQRTVGICSSVNMCGCSAADLERYMDQPAAARYLMCIQSHFHECFRLMSLHQTQ